MFHHILSEFMGTALMIVFGVGVHCDDVLKRTKYAGSGHMFAITTWAFGISVVLFVFGGVCINPAMSLAQAILGMIPWSYFIPYVIAEMLGGICGAVIVYIMYADHFKLSADSVDPIAIRNIFLQIRTNEIYQETILLKLLQRSFFNIYFSDCTFLRNTTTHCCWLACLGNRHGARWYYRIRNESST